MNIDRIAQWFKKKIEGLADLFALCRSAHAILHHVLSDSDEMADLKNFWPVVTLEDGRVIHHHDIIDGKFPS